MPSISSSSISTPSPTPPFKERSLEAQHQARSSLCSLYDLLADLDEGQLQYLVQEMNHTASQNMAVSQAISAIETENPSYSLSAARMNMQAPTMQRQLSKSQKLRLSLQTMFRAPSVRQQRRQQNNRDDGLVESDTPTSRRRKSPAYKRISRPQFNLPPGVTVVDLLNLLEAEFLYNNSSSQLSPLSSTSSSFSPLPSPSSTASPSSGRIRRHPSTMDMALEAERSLSASSVEGIALGLLEPRPTTPLCATPRTPISMKSSPITPTIDRSWRRDTPTPPPPPVVLDGIFEVLEHR